MLFPVFLAALAAIPSIAAQDVSSSATRCTTRFGYYALPTGTAGIEALPTYYRYTTTTNLFRLTYTTRDTVVATANATTLMSMVTTTATIPTTTTLTPAATTVAAPVSFIPLLAVANPTPGSRIRRAELEGGDSHALHLLKRQTPVDNTGGFIVDREGRTSSLNRTFAQRVDCTVSVVLNSTTTSIVTGLPETSFLAGATATSLSTITISSTTTLTEVRPQETIYAACQSNNVVNRITDTDGNTLVFDRVIYRPAEGFPIANELVVNTTSGTACCIACQTTPNCAGSFFAPSQQQCHLRLTQPPAATIPSPSALPALGAPSSYPSGGLYSIIGNASNATYPTSYPTASGIFPTNALSLSAPLSTGTAALANSNGTCARGSLSLYMGTIQGQTDFPVEYALVFSNGQCGRLSVWPVPVVVGLDGTFEDRRVKLI